MSNTQSESAFYDVVYTPTDEVNSKKIFKEKFDFENVQKYPLNIISSKSTCVIPFIEPLEKKELSTHQDSIEIETLSPEDKFIESMRPDRAPAFTVFPFEKDTRIRPKKEIVPRAVQDIVRKCVDTASTEKKNLRKNLELFNRFKSPKIKLEKTLESPTLNEETWTNNIPVVTKTNSELEIELEKEKEENKKKDRLIKQLKHQLELETTRSDDLQQNLKEHYIYNGVLKMQMENAVKLEKQKFEIEIKELQDQIKAISSINQILNNRNVGLIQQLKFLSSKDGIELSNCCICFAHRADVVFFPCRHAVLCTECSLNITQCPICRKNITDTYQLFLS